MIPTQNIVAWSNVVPWADPRQVEQDLIISRALIEIFSDPMLRRELRIRGGTATPCTTPHTYRSSCFNRSRKYSP